jgi:hypothetical protein
LPGAAILLFQASNIFKLLVAAFHLLARDILLSLAPAKSMFFQQLSDDASRNPGAVVFLQVIGNLLLGPKRELGTEIRIDD